MADRSAIEWTDSSWNPVSGCTKVSPGCAHCYAERIAERLRGTKAFPDGFDLVLHPQRVNLPKYWKRPRRIFVNSMSDLFHELVPFDYIDQIFSTMCEADHHVYQILTKRPERMLQWARSRNIEFPDHIWIGASVENQYWTKRIPVLLAVSARVRFLSCEPLLKPITLRDTVRSREIHWVIVGGESGPRARPMKAEWVRKLRDECKGAGIPFFFKQWGGKTSKSGGRILDGATWDEFPISSQVGHKMSDEVIQCPSTESVDQQLVAIFP